MTADQYERTADVVAPDDLSGHTEAPAPAADPAQPREPGRPSTLLGVPVGFLARLWWVAALVVAITIAAAVVATGASPTTYTGRASLIVSSNNRAPDQDAVLVQGFVTYFNDPSYQSQLLEQAGVDEPVTLVATSAATSPILLVSSTAASPAVAAESAAAVAAAFQADLNRVRDDEQQARIEQLEARIADVTERGGADAPTGVAALQDQIAQIEADTTNRLQELEFDGGVSTNAPSLVNNLVLGAGAGLLLGAIVALGLGRVLHR